MPATIWDSVFSISAYLAAAGTLTVFIGLYLETPLTIPIKRSSEDAIARAIKRTASLDKRKKLGEKLVIAGVACEFLFGVMVVVATLKIDEALRSRLIEVSPRAWLLTPEVNKHLVAVLKPFAGQKVDIVIRVHGDTTEPSFFAAGLRDIFKGSDWRDPLGKPFTDFFAPLVVDDAGVTGVLISVHLEGKSQRAAERLASALNSELPRLPAYLAPDKIGNIRLPFRPARDGDDVIVVCVGLKYPLLENP
jgi:hypothetical protein